MGSCRVSVRAEYELSVAYMWLGMPSVSSIIDGTRVLWPPSLNTSRPFKIPCHILVESRGVIFLILSRVVSLFSSVITVSCWTISDLLQKVTIPRRSPSSSDSMMVMAACLTRSKTDRPGLSLGSSPGTSAREDMLPEMSMTRTMSDETCLICRSGSLGGRTLTSRAFLDGSG